ncbi:MAG: GH36-type glycosyl hydrolase domain-containing protein [Candidatus Hermodarchaeota archaeon]
MKGNGYFGEWITDEHGLPAYYYKCNHLTDPIAKTKTSFGFSTDHFHQIGNDRIMGTAHNEGYVQVFDGSRGFKWLTFKDSRDGKLGGGIGLYYFENDNTYLSDLYTNENLKKYSNFERIFGIGYFKKKFDFNGIRLQHTVCTPFSDDPVILSEFNVSTELDSNRIKLIDFWDINLHPILKSLIVNWKNRKKFGKSKLLNLCGNIVKILLRISRKETETIRKRFARKFRYSIFYKTELNTIILTPKYRKKPPVSRSDPSKYDYYPKSLFLTIFNQNDVEIFTNKRDLFNKGEVLINWSKKDKSRKFKTKELCLGTGVSLNLDKRVESNVFTLFGYEEPDKIERLVNKYKKIVSGQSIGEWHSNQWKKSFINLKIKSEPQISRECIWHSYYTRSALFYDEFFEKHRLYQGSVYLFGHGIDGSIRDYMFYLNALILLNPSIAREFLLLNLSLISTDGKLPYSLHGYGKVSSVFVHSKPSDLYLFLLWGIEQYIFLTRDFDILDERVPFYDKQQTNGTDITEKIKRLINYIFSEKVGFGEHGLIKCNDGDWSDGISLMVKNRRKFIKNGESSFNSAFSLYIIPRVLSLLKDSDEKFVKSSLNKVKSLKQAILESYNGKWFYRGWDGQGNPIGDQSLYLEHHTWLLIAEVLENESAYNLIDQIYNILDKPSSIGQYISYPPQKSYLNILPKGWDINGGIWHAINALLTWGYSKYDNQKAFNSIIKNSLANRAENYPELWYGIWSAPDSYIADYAENAGEAFYHFATPMCDFPVMNLNAHASYLLSLVKIAGIDADISGLIIDSSVLHSEFSFESPLISLESNFEKLTLSYNINSHIEYKIKIKKPNWWSKQSKIYLNEREQIVHDQKTENFIEINILPNKGPILVELIK